MKTCEVRLYNGRSLFYAAHTTDGIVKDEFTDSQKAVGEHLQTPELFPVDAVNDVGYVRGTVKDFGEEPVPYKVRIWVLAEYEPERL